ncbi:MAG: twin-arginine translocase TatA/TatE family subunit [Chloroflexi bacterium]|nr:MAG: twin-arginine translocase TatA/TatE family subunit [Chloroflexota bacterium]TME17044.1 MAG: twin-arginine translocase TatA/TatE family subunit [Chloroflexota bacterium]TME17772.1 MAG: twin-arginine translocase TatA/TatE family subunit [Chloroflexota bacterium]
MPGFIGHWWFIILLVIVLIIFGPGKLPQLGGAVGQAIKEFRKATSELRDEVTRATSTEPEQPPPAPAPPPSASTPAPEPIKEAHPEPKA